MFILRKDNYFAAGIEIDIRRSSGHYFEHSVSEILEIYSFKISIHTHLLEKTTRENTSFAAFNISADKFSNFCDATFLIKMTVDGIYCIHIA